jgi:hypothetical protein
MIPDVARTAEAARHLDSALLKRLEVRRFGDSSKKRPRGQKVPAGQSYTEMEDEDDAEESTDEEDDEEDDEEEDDKNEEDQEFEDEVEAVLQGAETGDVSDKDEDLPESSGGGYVVAVYEGEWFLAEVARDQNNVQSGYTRLEYMAIKGKNAFTQPHKPDVMITLNEDILLEDVCPEPVNSRGCLGLNKSDLSKVTTLMVLVFISSKFSLSFFIPFMSTLNKFSLSFFTGYPLYEHLKQIFFVLFYPLYEHLKQIFGKLEDKKSTFFRIKVPKNTHSHTKSYICTIPMCSIPI